MGDDTFVEEGFSNTSSGSYHRDRARSLLPPCPPPPPPADTASGASGGSGDVPRDAKRAYTVLHEAQPEVTSRRLRLVLTVYSTGAWKLSVLGVLLAWYALDLWLYTFTERRPSAVAACVALLFNLVFALDVAVVVGLKFIRKWRKPLNLVRPDSWRVALDALVVLPFSLLYASERTLGYRWLIPGAAVLRCYRVFDYFLQAGRRSAARGRWAGFLFQYLTFVAVAMHTLSCAWYLFAYRGFDVNAMGDSWSTSVAHLPTETTLDWYLVCSYWSVMMLTTNALGDVYPVTTSERLAAAAAVLLGFTLTTIVYVGSLTSQFVNNTTRKASYVRRLQTVQSHLRLVGMDSDTTRRVIRHYEELWYRQSGVIQAEFLRLLPRPLQLDISEERCADALRSSLLLRRLPPTLRRRISHHMEQRFYIKGDVIYRRDHNKTAMICITQGVLQLLSVEDDESPMISLEKGTCFGESALVYSVPACCTVKAAMYTECQVLEKTEFLKLMVTCPEVHDELRQVILDRVVARRDRERLLAERGAEVDACSRECTVKVLKRRLRYLEGNNQGLTSESNEEHCLYLYTLAKAVGRQKAWILEPDGSLAVFWEFYMLAITLYLSVMFPYFIGFDRRFDEPTFHQIHTVISISILFNIAMDCLTAVKHDNLYIVTFCGIVQYRLNTFGFYMDVIALLPLENLVPMDSQLMPVTCAAREHLYYLFKGTKLCLVWRFSKFFEKLERKLLVNTIATKIWKYSVLVVLSCYWCGVLLYTEACFTKTCSHSSWFAKTQRLDKSSPFPGELRTDSRQIASVYFASSLLTSVAYGDFAPGDHFDTVSVAFLSLLAVLMIGYCIAEFSTVITHYSRTKTSFVEVIMTTEKFLQEKDFPKRIIERVTTYFEQQWQYNSGTDVTSESWLKEPVAPAEMRRKVLRCTRYKALLSVPLFRVEHKGFLDALLDRTKEMVLPPGEALRQPGAPARTVLIVDSGYCVVSDARGNCLKELGPGSRVGLLTMLFGVPDTIGITTLTHCKLISLDYNSFIAVCNQYPGVCEYSELLNDEKWRRQPASEVHTPVKSLYARRRQVTLSALQALRHMVQESVINVHDEYTRNGESYMDSYKQFGKCGRVASFFLLPICLRPAGPLLRVWTLFRVAAAYLLILLMPINLALDPPTYFMKALLLCDFISMVDMVVMLYVGVYGDKQQLIYHPYIIAKKYLMSAFLADLVTCFPWHILCCSVRRDFNHQPFSLYWQLLGLLQIHKTMVAFCAESKYSLKGGYLLNVLKFLLQTLFLLVLFACAVVAPTCRIVKALNLTDFERLKQELPLTKPYVNLPFQEGRNLVCREGSWLAYAGLDSYSLREVFLSAVYWSASSLCGAGLGEATPHHSANLLISIVASMQGCFFFGYVYASIAALKAVSNQGPTLFRENIKELQQFLEREQVPSELSHELLEYWKFQWKRTGGWSHQSVLNKLPPTLQEDALLFLYEETLREMPLFEHAGGSFFRAFVKQLQELHYMRGYTVMRSDEVTSLLYIVYRGKVDVLSDSNEMEACLGMGGMFGNIGGAPRYRALSTVVASRNMQVLYMDGSQFYDILKSYPSVLRNVEYSTKLAAKDYMLPTTTHQTSMVYPGDIGDSDSGEDEENDSAIFSGSHCSARRSTVGSHGSRSVLSLFGQNPHYVRAACLLFKPHRWFRSTVVPDDSLINVMDVMTLILSYIDFMLIAYQLAFLTMPFYIYICIPIDVICLYKLFLDIHTGYISKYGDYVLQPKRVRAKYFSGQWVRRRDLIANLPLCYLALALPLRSTTPAFSYLRLPQLLRLTNLLTFQRQRNNDLAAASFLLNIGFVAVWVSALAHVSACLFFKLSCLTAEHCLQLNWMSKQRLDLRQDFHRENYFSIYVASLWYIMNLITITGTGDVSAMNEFEIIETIIIIVIIRFCIGLLISEISALMGLHAASRAAYERGVSELGGPRQLGATRAYRVLDYMRRLWARRRGQQMPVLLTSLPPALLASVQVSAYGAHVARCAVFARVGPKMARELARWLRPSVLFPGDYVVRAGDVDQRMYFVHRGEVEVLTVHPNGTESVYDVLGPEDSFGIVQGVLVGVPHRLSFRARTAVDVLSLELQSWRHLLELYPDAAVELTAAMQNLYIVV